MKNVFTTKRICRAGIIASLYVALTYLFMPFAYGPLQIRPAEALCILPLFFPEAVPALYVGCMLANLASTPADIFLGSLATLFAACCTYAVGQTVKNTGLKLLFGGLFPVLFNAFGLPLIIVFLSGGGAEGATVATYFSFAFSIGLSETVWVYALGVPLYFLMERLQEKLPFLQ